MDVVQKLLDERRQLYAVVKKNCVRKEIVTGHCEDCHDLHVGVEHYDDVTLNDPPAQENLHHIDDEWQNIEDSPYHPPLPPPQPVPPPPIESESESEVEEEDTNIQSESEQESESNSIDENNNQEQINNNVPLFL